MARLGAMAVADKREGVPLWQLAEANRDHRIKLAQAKGRDAKMLSPEVESQRSQIADASKRRSDEIRRELANANQAFRSRLDEVARSGGQNPITLPTRLELEPRPTLTDPKELSQQTAAARENLALRSLEQRTQREMELTRENHSHQVRVAGARARGRTVMSLPDETEAMREKEAVRMALRRSLMEKELANANRDHRARLAEQSGRDAKALSPRIADLRQRKQEELAAKWGPGPRRNLGRTM